METKPVVCLPPITLTEDEAKTAALAVYERNLLCLSFSLHVTVISEKTLTMETASSSLRVETADR